MDLTADLSQAVRRAETKRQIAKLLDPLPAADRKAVLLDLIAEGSPSSAAPEVVGPPPRAPVGRPRILHPARPTDGEAATGRTDLLLGVLMEKPRTGIGDLAMRVYGDSGESSRNRVRSLLASLKKQDRVRNVGTGEWEVVPP